jgi:outer membrane immunogenic protein
MGDYMRRYTLAALTAAGLALGLVQTASAADIARPVYKAPVIVPAYNWSGFYIGGNVGYGWGDVNSTAFGFGASDSIDGWFAGGQIGYNWQGIGSPWVFGIEVDSQWANIEKNVSAVAPGVVANAFSTLDYFGTARARVGYAWDRVMFYGTGGLAWGRNEIGFGVASGPFAAGISQSNTHIGWTVGAGVEWALVDNWTAKVEYLYVKLGNENYFGGVTGTGLGFDSDLDVHTVKVGLNYRFGYGKAPVVAKY